MQTYFMDLFTVIAACWFYSSNLERSTSQKVPQSKGLQFKKAPKSKGPKSNSLHVKMSPSQMVYNHKVPKSKGPQSKDHQSKVCKKI